MIPLPSWFWTYAFPVISLLAGGLLGIKIERMDLLNKIRGR